LRDARGSLWPVVAAVLLVSTVQVPRTALAEEGSLVVEVLRSPDPYEVKIVIEGPGGTWTFEGRSSVSLTGVTSGTYTVKVYYRGYLVATRAAVVNRDNVALSIPIPFVDLVLRAVDLKGRELSGRLYAKVEPRDGYSDLTVSGSSIVIRRALEPVAYSVYVEWESPLYAKKASANLTEPAWSLMRRGTVQLPVTDLTISVIDKEGKGVGGAEVRIANQVLTTGEEGRLVVQRVPVEYRGEPVSYDVEVRYMGYLVYRGPVLTSTTNYAFTFTADLRRLTVMVLGEAGQGIPNAKVSLLREGNEVGTAFTDAGGRASFEGVIPVEYFLRVEYKTLSQTLRVLPSQMTGRPITLQLSIYIELGGVPLSAIQLYVLVGGTVAAVVAVAATALLLVRRKARKVRAVGPVY
jgi:hypothetical protein